MRLSIRARASYPNDESDAAGSGATFDRSRPACYIVSIHVKWMDTNYKKQDMPGLF